MREFSILTTLANRSIRSGSYRTLYVNLSSMSNLACPFTATDPLATPLFGLWASAYPLGATWDVLIMAWPTILAKGTEQALTRMVGDSFFRD